MTLIELIEKAGQDNINVQAINNAYTKSKNLKGGVTEVTFTTQEINTTELMQNKGKVGLIMWIERDNFE